MLGPAYCFMHSWEAMCGQACCITGSQAPLFDPSCAACRLQQCTVLPRFCPFSAEPCLLYSMRLLWHPALGALLAASGTIYNEVGPSVVA